MSMSLVFRFYVFFLCIICTNADDNHGTHSHNDTDHNDIFSAGLEIKNCKITPVDQKLRTKLSMLLAKGKKLIFIRLSFEDHKNFVPKNYNGDIYKPTEWVRTYGRHGRSLLFLRPQFEHLSLTTLSFDTAHINVELRQTPSRCLTNYNLSTIERNLRRLLVMDFKMSHTEDDHFANEKICNVHVKNDDSVFSFQYVCCEHNHDITEDHLICNELPRDYWMDMLFMCVFFIKVLVVMFCPLLIPETLYRKKYTESVYEHKMSKPIKLKVKKITEGDKSNILHKDIPTVTMGKLSKMQKNYEWNKVNKMREFYETINDAPYNKVITLAVKKLKIVVRYDRLLPSNYVPVGIFRMFYTMFVKCHIRKSGSFAPCCRSSMFAFGFKRAKKPLEDHGNEKDIMTESKQSTDFKPKHVIKYPWYKCLRQTMRFILFLCLLVPWVIRVYFYYAYEQFEGDYQLQVASIRNMTLPAFKWNLTYTLTPIHPMFLICYGIIVFDAFVFCVVNERIKKKLQSLMRKSLRDMRQVSKMDKFKGSFALLLVPCEMFGIFGFLFSGFYFIFAIPIILFSLAFYCLPTIHLTLRLLAHFLAYLTLGACSREHNISFRKKCNFLFSLFHLDTISRPNDGTINHESLKEKILQIFVLLACLLTVFALVLLSMETIIFFVELVLYTVIGIIMNSDDMLKYITLMFMLGVYARNCFKGITDKYLKFNKSINSLIVDTNRPKVEAVANERFEEQKNTAFQISTENFMEVPDKTEEPEIQLTVKNGTPKWSVPKLILFLDRHDQPYITEKFFFQTCYMDTIGVPGPLIPNIINAIWRFLCIFAFLMFVVLIVLAFGDEYNISGANQMLATLAGGLLPWIFSNILFKPRDPLELDVNNLSFKSSFKTTIDDYTQNWDIHDITVENTMIENCPKTMTNCHDERIDEKENAAVIMSNENEQDKNQLIETENTVLLLNTDDNSEHSLDFLVVEKTSKITHV